MDSEILIPNTNGTISEITTKNDNKHFAETDILMIDGKGVVADIITQKKPKIEFKQGEIIIMGGNGVVLDITTAEEQKTLNTTPAGSKYRKEMRKEREAAKAAAAAGGMSTEEKDNLNITGEYIRSTGSNPDDIKKMILSTTKKEQKEQKEKKEKKENILIKQITENCSTISEFLKKNKNINIFNIDTNEYKRFRRTLRIDLDEPLSDKAKNIILSHPSSKDVVERLIDDANKLFAVPNLEETNSHKLTMNKLASAGLVKCTMEEITDEEGTTITIPTYSLVTKPTAPATAEAATTEPTATTVEKTPVATIVEVEKEDEQTVASTISDGTIEIEELNLLEEATKPIAKTVDTLGQAVYAAGKAALSFLAPTNK